MSRSGYSEDLDPLEYGRWRGMVASALRGKRGRRLMRDLADSLDAMTDRRLIAGDLEDDDGCVCVLGAAARHRGVDVDGLDPEDPVTVAHAFDIAQPLAQEVVFMNDEDGRRGETPTERWLRVRLWVAGCLGEEPTGEVAAYAAGAAFRHMEFCYNSENWRISDMRRWAQR